MTLLVALSAIIVPFIMLVLLKMPAAKGMTISSLVVITLAFLVWGMETNVILASILQGAHKTLTILWILMGALILLNTLRNTGAITRINQGFQFISTDMRVQAVLVAFLFGALIEGAAGFGTPAMVAGPLLISLGFTPMAAATLALIADSTSVPFGAVGTPVTVGLSNIPEASIPFFHEVANRITFMDLFAGTFMPLILIVILTAFFGKEKNVKHALPMVPWALLIGIVYTGSAFAYSRIFGHEFVSILASLTGLAVAAFTAQKGILVPSTPWQGALKDGFKVDTEKSEMNIFAAWSPYLIVVALLLLTRIVPWLNSFTKTAINLSWNNILGIQGINSGWEFLYSPGSILTAAAILAFLFQRKSASTFTSAAKESIASMKMTSISLVATLAMVQVFSNSGINASGLLSMPQFIAESFANNLGGIWIFVAPFLGELGAFITGSATVSTLTFSPIQYNVAGQVGIDAITVLAAQVIGGAAGNMICVHNVVAASAVVGLEGSEGAIIRKTLLPAIIYGLLIGFAGLLALNLF